MIMTEKLDELKTLGYVFKVLSGSLNGIEFSLGSHDYFMCVGDAAEGQGNLAQNLGFAERTLYLPTTTPGHNFTVNLAEKATKEGFEVTVSYETHQETLALSFNTVCQVGGVQFALKREGEAWSQEVLTGALPTSVKVEAQATATPGKSRYLAWVYKGVAAASLILLGFGGASVWLHYNSAPVDTSPKILEQLMSKHTGYSVQLGRDNTYYIFALNNREAEWARQAVARSKTDESWKVVTPDEEAVRLSRILDRLKVNFFTIRFSDLRAPTLVMSSTNNATDEVALKNVRKALLDMLPYAHTVNIELQSDKDVLRQAQEGLLARGFDYQMIQSDSGVTLSIHLTAGDGRLAEFSRFVEGFSRTWGRRYVHFSAELGDNWLKEKSFKYGQDGYVKMSKSHWLFNNQN